MKHLVKLFLETDTIDWLDTVAANLSRQRKSEVTRAGALEYIVQRHWKKTSKRIASKRFDEKVTSKALELR